MIDVWIVGATSHVAKALISVNAVERGWRLTLFARSEARISAFLETIHFALPFRIEPIENLGLVRSDCDAVINCVGFGTPKTQRSAGVDLFLLAEKVDNTILELLERSSKTAYVNFSSGAVYGSTRDEPVPVGASTEILLDPMNEQDLYRIAKMYQEAKHRAHKDLHIVDVRLFSFFSRFADLDAGFLLTDIARALASSSVFTTSEDEIYRDFVSPRDLYGFLDRVVRNGFMNTALDVYSAAPLSKSVLLNKLIEEFGLVVQRESKMAEISPTGHKPYYYSQNHRAEATIGFKPSDTSWDGIRRELAAMGLPRSN